MDNIGKTIKIIAAITAIFFALIFFIGGIALVCLLPNFFWIGLIVMIGGILTSLFSFFMLYGYGEMIDRICSIEQKICRE